MKQALEQIVMMLPVFGFGFLQASPRVETAPPATPKSPLFRLTAGGV
jgi:hypothetical protein